MSTDKAAEAIRQQLVRLQRTVDELERQNRSVNDRNSVLANELRQLKEQFDDSGTTPATEQWYGDDTPLGDINGIVRGGINEL
jgi:hypothetical protein